VTPLGHLAVSVLLARALGLGLGGRRALALVVAGVLLPDLVDKPLVALGVVPVAHTVGHSVVVLAGVALAVTGVARLRPAAPAVVGWAGHVAADLVVAYPRFLVNYAWPLLAPRPTPDEPVVAYWVAYARSPLGALELLLVAAAALVLWRVGRPA
jgi:hypothetical protein